MSLPVGMHCTQRIGKKRDVGVFTGNRRLKCSFSERKFALSKSVKVTEMMVALSSFRYLPTGLGEA